MQKWILEMLLKWIFVPMQFWLLHVILCLYFITFNTHLLTYLLTSKMQLLQIHTSFRSLTALGTSIREGKPRLPLLLLEVYTRPQCCILTDEWSPPSSTWFHEWLYPLITFLFIFFIVRTFCRWKLYPGHLYQFDRLCWCLHYFFVSVVSSSNTTNLGLYETIA